MAKNIRIDGNKIYVTPEKPKMTPEEVQTHLQARLSHRVTKNAKKYNRKAKHKGRDY